MAEKEGDAGNILTGIVTEHGNGERAERPGRGYERLAGEALGVLFRLEERGGAMGRNVVLEGASGVRHELDLVLEIPRKGKMLYAAVECKDTVRPVEKEKVAAFRSVLQDLNEKGYRLGGIMAASSGFQAGAAELARFSGIALLEIRRPGEKEWLDYVRRLQKEYRKAGFHSPSGPEISLTTNERIRVVPAADADGSFPPAWRMDTPLARDPHSLTLAGKSLAERLREIALEGSGGGSGRREIEAETPGEVLKHLVWEGELPISKLAFSFDDLSSEAKDAILYGREKPEIFITDPLSNRRVGIRKGKAEWLPDR